MNNKVGAQPSLIARSLISPPNLSWIALFFVLLPLSLVSPASPAQSEVPAEVVYRNIARTPYLLHSTATEACAYNILGSSLYSDPLGVENDPTWGNYCWYTLTYPGSPPVRSIPGTIYQGWFDSLSLCPEGYTYYPVDVCRCTNAIYCPKYPGCEAQNKTGNPIFIAYGNKFQREVDYAGVGEFPLRLERVYNSIPAANQYRLQAGARGSLGAFGGRWLHTYSRMLKLVSNGTLTVVYAYRPDGRLLFFRPTANGWSPDADINDKLTELKDALGVTTGWKYRTGTTEEVETYGAQGLLISLEARMGQVQSLTYSNASTSSSVAPRPGLLVRVTDHFRRQINFSYDSQGRISTMTDPSGGVYGYLYTSNGFLASIQYPDGKTRSYLYDEEDKKYNTLPGALTGIIDENGHRFATFTYKSGGAISSEHAGGAEKVTLSYNVNGTATVSDYKDSPTTPNTSRTYSFQTILGVVKNTGVSQPCATCGGGVSQSTTYDANGNVASKTDFNGHVTTYTYDLERNLETPRTEAAGTPDARTITTEWHPSFRLPTRITEPNRVTDFTYDSNGNLLQKTITSGTQSRTWNYTYNAQGQVLTADGPRTDVSDITTYSYYTSDDPSGLYRAGDLQSLTNALGHTTQITAYDAHGRPQTLIDPNGLVTQLDYWPRGWLKSRRAGNELTRYDYDAVGQLTSVTLPDGSSLSYTYDPAHRLTAIQDTLGNRIDYTLDLMGNRTQEDIYDPQGTLRQTHARIYNPLNRLEQELSAENHSTGYTYDNNGNLKTQTDPLNHVTTYDYDGLNRLAQITDANTGITSYGYDGLDHLSSVTDPHGLVTTYQHDGLDNLLEQLSPDTGATTHTYDSAGNLKSSTDARAKTTTYTYDALNRLTQVKFADTTTVKYAYDAAPNALGRLTRMTDPSGATEWRYDVQGRLLEKRQTNGNVVFTLSYGYDLFGRLSAMSYPSGKQVTLSYDGAGRLHQIAIDGEPLLSGIGYHPFGPPTDWTWGSGAMHQRTVDLDGRLQAYPLGAATETLSFDPAGRLTEITGGAPRSYGYDDLDRLTSYLNGSTNQLYEYDANGNRLGFASTTANNIYHPDPFSNRLLSISGTTPKSFTYDPAGNLSADGAYTYTYNARGRLAKVTYGALSNTYTHNGRGERVTKAGNGGTRRFVYDEAGHLVGEYDSSGAAIQETLYLGDTPLAVLTRKETLVDNTTTARVTLIGTWPTATAVKGYQGSNYLTHPAGTDAESVTWTPSLTTGSYRIYARWTAATDRASNATYTVRHSGGDTPVSVNQQQNGGQWYLLGTYPLAANQGHGVQLTDAADGLVVADAVKFVPVTLTTRFQVQADHLDTPRALTDSQNRVIWRWDPDPFGVGAPNPDPDGNGVAFSYNLRFPGQYFDAETKLHYNYFRDYDPTLGRYVQSDPIGLAGGLNTYAYVGNNPLSWIDLFGLELISPEEGQRIVDNAKTWQGVPYFKNGGDKSSREKADCSGATWKIYEESGFPYGYSSSSAFPSNPRFKPSPGNVPQPGDVGRWDRHVLIYDPNAGGKNDSWSARREGVPYGPAQSKWWDSNGPVQWYRYDKPDNCSCDKK